jgi:hypothetical protein
MKYLINSKTKEHKVYRPDTNYFFDADCRIVQADSEGWIKHDGGECPLPDDVRCAVKIADGSTCSGYFHKARQWEWETSGDMSHDITHYRPILEQAEPVQEQTKTTLKVPQELQFTPRCIRCGAGGIAPHDPHCPNGKNLIDRLKAAHEAAQTIPDLEAELRKVLAGMGYDLVTRSPFTQQRHGAQEE